MSSSYDNTVFDFDLEFFNQTATNNADPDLQARADRLRKSVLFLKKRVKFVDEYVSAFYAASKRVQELEVIETQLKDRCKQHHVEIGSFIEKVTKLENDIHSAQEREREKNEKISELENQIVALHCLHTQLKQLEIEKNKTELPPVKVEKKNGKAGVTNNAKKEFIEVETLRKENEKLRKENSRIPNLEKEIESLRQNIPFVSKSEKISGTDEVARVQHLEKEIEILCKKNAKISILEKEIVTLNNKNSELSKLEKEVENLTKRNAELSKLEKEVAKLQKENVKIPKLGKEIESLRKENYKITKLKNEDETILKQSVEISNLEKDIETLRIKNSKFEMENKALRKEIAEISNKKDREAQLIHLTSITNEKDKLLHKLPRKYKSLPDTNGEWCDYNQAKNDLFEDHLLSPAPDGTIIVDKSPIADKDVSVQQESDNDYSNEVASVDDGRGSSLANSDTDKSLHSPEFVLNNNEITENENDIENNDTPVSTSIMSEMVTSTTTAVVHDKNQNICESKNVSQSKIHPKLSSAHNQIIASKEVSKRVDIFDKTGTKKRNQGEREKECLEMNNSLRCHSDTDVELRQIFSTMKLNYKLISPIPKTPVQLHEQDSTNSSIELQKKKDICNRLSKETGVFLMQLSLRLDTDPSSVTVHDCDRLIACFDSILKSKQIVTESSIPNTNTDMKISDSLLSHRGHKLVSISYHESTSVGIETELLQNKNGENRLSQNESWPIDETHHRMLRDNNKSIPITNPSPPDIVTNVIKHKQVGDGLQCLSTSMEESQNLNHSICEELSLSSKISEVTDSVRCDNQSHLTTSQKAKNKKITKLGRLKKKLEPKYKIRMEKTPPRKLRPELKKLSHINKHVTVHDTFASLNQKDAYEKAVKVMAELNSQKGAKAKLSPNFTKVLTSPRRTTLENGINSNGDIPVVQNGSIKTISKRKNSGLFDNCSVVLIKDPLLVSPVKADNSKNHKAEKVREDLKTQLAKADKYLTNERSTENNSSKTERANKNIVSITPRANENIDSITQDSNSMTNQIKDDSSTTFTANEVNNSKTHIAKGDNSSGTHQAKENNSSKNLNEVEIQVNATYGEPPSKKRRRRFSDEPLIEYKRALRSATIKTRLSTEDNIELSLAKGVSSQKTMIDSTANDTQHSNENNSLWQRRDQHTDSDVGYGDLDIFAEDVQIEKETSASVKGVNSEVTTCHPKESILCYMLEKHGVETVRLRQKKIPDNKVKQICEKLEKGITTIAEAKDNKTAMNNFVDDLRKLNYKHFIAGLMKFLAKPERKDELFGKVNIHPAPPMTKAEQILLYAIHQLESYWPAVNIVDAILCSIEFTLFKLNRTPDFSVIETTSHFYAILCRYIKAKSRLRLFMLDAMYCIQFKSVPLIKQCLEVWMHIIPLSHMGIAKSPLVTCLVYLLHFYKCDDKFNRVQEIRNILRQKYYYQITDWNETKILEMLSNSIKDLKDISIEKKMLRLALIILAKRNGPHWCQNNIIKNLLQPMIEKENVRNVVKEFCVSMIGPLMKPYPVDMKVHCEIAINQLVDILNNNPSPEMEEAAITSMMFINRHDQRSVNRTLLSRKMKPMSLALEKSIRDYVKAKPLKIWKNNILTNAR